LTLGTAACGTTEARTNDDLEPGSGELGPGDAVDPDAEAPLDEELGEIEDDVDVDATTPSTASTTTGARCGTPDAADAIDDLPTRLFTPSGAPERVTALQMGEDPEVVALVARAETFAHARVTRIVCVDDGSATIAVEFADRGTVERRAGSAMLVDGSWRVTLHAFCRWTDGELCSRAVAAQALDALSPALREHVAPPGS
jgi:hypothetical protein